MFKITVFCVCASEGKVRSAFRWFAARFGLPVHSMSKVPFLLLRCDYPDAEAGAVACLLKRSSVSASAYRSPFARWMSTTYGTEFVNDRLIEYCLGHGIELTRSRPYRKNDQARIEQKNAAVVRKLLGYRRFEGIAAAKAITRLYGGSRLFMNFFQPSFKLAA